MENINEKEGGENGAAGAEGTQTQTPPKQEKKKDTVEIERSVLEEILRNQKAQQEKIEMLTSVADKARLAHWDKLHPQGNLIRRANLGKWKGKIVIGWAKVKDEVGFIHGVLREEQIIKLFLDNGTKEPETEDVEFLTFYRNVERVFGDIVKESRGAYGETRTLQLEDGRQFEVDIRFINL